MAETNGELVGRLKQVAFFIREVGLVPLLFLGVLGMFTGYVPSPITETKAAIAEHTRSTESYQETHLKILQELVRAQRASCVVQARTESDRRMCVQ